MNEQPPRRSSIESAWSGLARQPVEPGVRLLLTLPAECWGFPDVVSVRDLRRN